MIKVQQLVRQHTHLMKEAISGPQWSSMAISWCVNTLTMKSMSANTTLAYAMKASIRG